MIANWDTIRRIAEGEHGVIVGSDIHEIAQATCNLNKRLEALSRQVAELDAIRQSLIAASQVAPLGAGEARKVRIGDDTEQPPASV